MYSTYVSYDVLLYRLNRIHTVYRMGMVWIGQKYGAICKRQYQYVISSRDRMTQCGHVLY